MPLDLSQNGKKLSLCRLWFDRLGAIHSVGGSATNCFKMKNKLVAAHAIRVKTHTAFVPQSLPTLRPMGSGWFSLKQLADTPRSERQVLLIVRAVDACV